MVKKWKVGLWLVAPLTIPLGVLVMRSAPSPQQHGVALAATQEKPKQVPAEAQERLKKMTDFLAGMKSFRVENATTDEVVTKSGEKVQIAADSRVSLVRPNRLRSEQIVAPNAMTFVYDGKTVTLYCKETNTYAVAPAPATLDPMIDMVRSKYNADTPGADLIYSNPYDVLMEQVKNGFVVGPEVIDGTLTQHLAFIGDTVDWQIWIKDGNDAVPMRYVITTKDLPSRPQFTVELTHWEPQAVIEESVFAFTPPANAKKVDKMPTECGHKQQKP